MRRIRWMDTLSTWI